MNKKDLDALSGLYKSVYSPTDSGEYLSEDYIDEQLKGIDGKPIPVSAADKKRAENEARFQQRAAAYKAKGGSNYAAYLAGGGNKAKSSSPSAAPQDIERQGKSALNAKAAKDKIANASQADKNKAAENIFKLKPGSLATPGANKPSTPAGAKPATPGANKPLTPAGAKPATPGSGAKVVPSSAAKPATPAPGTKAAGPDSIKPKTPNPLMQRTFGYQTGNAPDQIKAASAGADPKKAEASFARSKQTANKLGMSGSLKAISSGYEWPSAKTIRDIAGAYASIYEAKKKDQDEDGDNDFADVRIARMIASGMSKAEAIAAVKNKEYNEEFELDEATRMRKELGKEGETATRKELAARSKAHKRSGSVDKTIAAAERAADWSGDEKKAKALRGLAASRRGSVRDKPRAGLRGYAAKVEGGDKDLQTSRQKAMSAGTLTPKEKKQLGEVYEIVASYLLENNFATTINDANAIIENMSEVWLNQILENAE